MRSLPTPDLLRSVGMINIYEYTERAIKVDRDFTSIGSTSSATARS